MTFWTIFYKPEDMSESELFADARNNLEPHTHVKNLRPVLLAANIKDIYIVQSVMKPLEEFGYNVIIPKVNKEEILELRQGLESGKLDVLDFKRNIVYQNTDFQLNASLYVPDLNEINEELIEYLSRNPKMLYELHWRKFEELLSALFRSKGYDTELGPGSGDGGVDIRMVSKSGVTGNFLTLVQAKRYSEKNRIKLTPVQALYGVLEAEKASSGLFVTTSSYEPCARRFAESHPYRLKLADKSDIRTWLREFNGFSETVTKSV